MPPLALFVLAHALHLHRMIEVPEGPIQHGHLVAHHRTDGHFNTFQLAQRNAPQFAVKLISSNHVFIQALACGAGNGGKLAAQIGRQRLGASQHKRGMGRIESVGRHRERQRTGQGISLRKDRRRNP